MGGQADEWTGWGTCLRTVQVISAVKDQERSNNLAIPGLPHTTWCTHDSCTHIHLNMIFISPFFLDIEKIRTEYD